MARVKRLAPAVIAALALALPAASVAATGGRSHSTTACRNRIVNEWVGTGKIATTFAPRCYQAALKYVAGRPDLQEYSNFSDDIRQALQAAKERKLGKSVPSFVVNKKFEKTSTKVRFTTTEEDGTQVRIPVPKDPGGGGPQGPSAVQATPTSSSSSGLPTPVIVLGAIAIALIAAGAIGAGLRARRR